MFNKRLPTVNVQRLFGAALILKIALSIASVLAKSPLILGLVLPLVVMLAYIIIGYTGRDSEVSEERFADSCYYIGFIFTITSIVASLFDLQNLTGPEGMHNISLRFGAAMVSTVIGMSVRVYLVSFRKNTDDAVRDAESAVLDAARVFITQLNVAVDNFRQFEQHVVDSTKLTVEHVNQQVESIGKQYAQSLNGFYSSLTSENKAALETLIGEVRMSTNKLADSVDIYSGGIKSNLEGIERKVTDFADAVSKRLASTTFPDDYFVRELRGPLNLLKDEATLLGDSVRAVSSEVGASSETLSEVLKRITGKSKKSEVAMDAVVSLSEQHQTIVTNAGMQLASLVSLGERLENVDLTLRSAQDAFAANANASHELMAKLATLAGESAGLRSEIKDSFTVLVDKLDTNTTLATNVIKKLEDQTAELVDTTDDLLAGLDAQVTATGEVALRISEAGAVTESTLQRLHDIAATNADVVAAARETVAAAVDAARLTSDVTQQITEVARRVETSVGQGIQVAHHLETLEAARHALVSLPSEGAEPPKHDSGAVETATQPVVVNALTTLPVGSPPNQVELTREPHTAAPLSIGADKVACVASASAMSADVVAVATPLHLPSKVSLD